MTLNRRILTLCALLFVVAEALFLFNLGFPSEPNFDEAHYLPAARQFIAGLPVQNLEHPPLAKQLIAAGIAVLGDNPYGWRIPATLFGGLTLVGMFLWAYALFASESLALFAALITLFNQLLFVQARIAMLDTFMFCFVAFAMAAFSWTLLRDLPDATVRRIYRLAGALLGLALACKWSALFAWGLCIATLVLSKQAKPRELGVSFVLIPGAVYFATFLPYLSLNDIGPLGILDLQARMLELQTGAREAHTYMSSWLDWPLLKRVMWYRFEAAADKQSARGILLLGNPLVMWGGLLALLACLRAALRKDRVAALIGACWAAFYLPWALMPSAVQYYYYYYPSAMVLSLALAKALANRPRAQAAFALSALVLFVFFYPILAGIEVPVPSIGKWMWFRGAEWRWFELNR